MRGIWLRYAASDAWVEKLSEPLTLENAKRANEGPMLAEMLKQLESNPQFACADCRATQAVPRRDLESIEQL